MNYKERKYKLLMIERRVDDCVKEDPNKYEGKVTLMPMENEVKSIPKEELNIQR